MSTKFITAMEGTCESCQAVFLRRTEAALPKSCPSCKSKAWNKSGRWAQKRIEEIGNAAENVRVVLDTPKTPTEVLIQRAYEKAGIRPKHAINCKCGMCAVAKQA